MAKRNHKLKWKKKKAQVYQRLLSEVHRAACALNISEEEVCFKVIVTEADCYVSNFRLQEGLRLSK